MNFWMLLTINKHKEKFSKLNKDWLIKINGKDYECPICKKLLEKSNKFIVDRKW